MKKVILFIVVLFCLQNLSAQEINWHSMTELTNNINTIETPIFVYAAFHNDYLGGLFDDEVLTDSKVIRTLSEHYYCVRIYSREDTSKYTLFGKTYGHDNFSNHVLFAVLGYIAVIPVQIILDQGEGVDSLNVIYSRSGYITADSFYVHLQKNMIMDKNP